jgi:hypothetical protein
VSVLIIALVIKRLTNFPAGIFVNISLLALSTLYFFSAFASFKDEQAGGIEIFVNKLLSWSCSVGITAILFRLESFKGYKPLAAIGCGILLILLPVILYIKSKKRDLKLFNSRYLIRMSVICFLGFFLAFTSRDVLVNLGILEKVKIEESK